MRKLFAWVLFFVLILGSYQAIQYALDRPELARMFSEVKDKVDQSVDTFSDKKEEKAKNIVLKDTTGKQKGTFTNEYGEQWQMTHNGYEQFTLESSNGKGGYIAGQGRTLFNTTIGETTYGEVQKQYGAPLEEIRKGNNIFKMNDDNKKEMLLYEIDGYYVTFFFDVHNANRLRAIQYIPYNVEQKKEGFYGRSSNALRTGFEQLMIELMNQARVEHGLKPLIYDKGLTAQARAHSQDMIDQHYFSHTGSNGSTPESRMKNAGYLNEHFYAENLAYGQYSSIFAHEGLMNSLGHRKNILNKDLTHAGVGVAFDAENVPYYTINFYTPF